MAGALAIVAPVPVIALACAVTLLIDRDGTSATMPRRGAHQKAAFVLIVASGLSLGAMRAHLALASFAASEQAVDQTLPRLAQCAGLARVESSSVLVRGTVRFGAVLMDADCDGHRATNLHVSLYGGPSWAARGDELHVLARLAPPDRFENPDLGDPRPARARRGVTRTGSLVWWERASLARGPPAWIDRARARVRERIEATFPAETSAMARALVLGETDLSDDDDSAFRASGLAHLLAVSGMHLVLVVVSAVGVLRALLLRVNVLAARLDVSRIASFVGIPLAWIYADFAGGSGSARRAAWMLTVGLLTVTLGRRADPVRTFALSLIAGAIADPLAVFDVSFVLSAAATGGLIAFSSPLAEFFSTRLPKWLHGVSRGVAVTLSATLLCAPILATFAPTLPLLGALANLVAVPVGEAAALPLCLAHAALSPWPAAERGSALLASGALHIVLWVARASASMGQVEVPRPTSVQLAALAFALCAWLLTRGSRRRFALMVSAVVLLLAEIEAIHQGHPEGQLRATFLDVGQGDATLLDLPDGSAMLIDGGGLVGSPVDIGKRVIAPLLRARRRSTLALVVLSHPHPDHVSGLATGLDRVVVARAWDTGQGETEGTSGTYAAWLAKMRVHHTRIEQPATFCGSREIGGAWVDVLAPCPRPLPERTPNDNSIVLRIRYGSRVMFFVGDAEHEEEQELLSLPPKQLRADVLKVGHHGSRTSSSPDFVAAVRPSVAVLSCGRRNHYGHPAPSTLETLEVSRLFRTDLDGAVVVTTDGSSLEVRSAVDGSAPAFYSRSP